MSDDYEKSKRAIDERAKAETEGGGSSEQAHRHWSEVARESDKTTVHRPRSKPPTPTTGRIPFRIVIHK